MDLLITDRFFDVLVEQRAATREYSGSSKIKLAAVWIDNLSSSLVVARHTIR